MYRRKLPPNLRLWRPCCQFSESRASTVVSQARIGVAAYVSPIPEKPWTLNHGAPQAPGPPKPMPRIPSCETMSLLNAHVEIVITVHARADDSWLSHHRASAGHHAHVHVRLGNIGFEEELRGLVDVS